MSTLHRLRLSVASVILGVLAFFGVVGAIGGDPVGDALEDARTDVIQRRHEAALEKLKALIAAHADRPEAAEARILLGRVLMREKKWDDAVLSLSETIGLLPKAAPWRAKARFLLADALVRKGDGAAAAAIYRDEAELRIGVESRRDLAMRFEALGDEFFNEKKEKKGPVETVRPPDYARAFTFYSEARFAASPSSPHRQLSRKAGEAALRAGNTGEAEAIARAMLKHFGEKGPDPDDQALAEARALLGRSLLAQGRRDDARQHLDDLARSPAGAGPAFAELDIWMGESYGLPAPANERDLKAGLEHWDRFLSKHPSHGRSAWLRLRKIEALRAFAMSEAAEAACRDFLEKSKGAPEAPEIAYLIGLLRIERGEFPAARQSFREFVAAYPNDPRVPAAQGLMPELFVQEGSRLLQAEKKDEAVRVWNEFLLAFPMHPSAAGVSVDIGRVHYSLKRYDEAKAIWASTQERYRDAARADAATAAYLLGVLLEENEKKLVLAAEQFKKAAQTFSGEEGGRLAAERLAAMERVELEIRSERAFTADQTPTVRLTLRNTKTVTLKVHPIDMAVYFRAKHATDGFEALDTTLIRAAATWTFEVPDYAAYRRDTLDVPIRAVDSASAPAAMAPGAYLVTVDDGKRRALVAVLVSDLRAVVKSSARQTFVYVADARKKAAVEGATVLVSDGAKIVWEGKTKADGTAVHDFDAPNPNRRVFVVKDGHPAPGCVSSTPAQEAFTYSPKVRITTDRPLYAPGQTVRFRLLARAVANGNYALPKAGTEVPVAIVAPSGAVAWAERVKLGEMGSGAASFETSEQAMLGDWTVRAEFAGQTFTTPFRLRVYQKPTMLVDVSISEASAFGQKPGDTVKARVLVTDLFGGPVKNAPVSWIAGVSGFSFNAASLDEYSWLLDFDRKNENVAVDDLHEIAAEGAGFTDERGRLEIEFKSRVVSRDLAYVLVAEATDPEGDLTPASGSTEFHATGQSFFGKVEADKSVYKKGDKLTAKVLTVGPGGLAVSRTGTLKIYAVDPKTRRRREVGAAGVSTGVDGRAVAEVVLSESGETVAAFEAKGRHGEDVSIESTFFVSAQAFDPDKNVRVLAERDIYREGETLTAYYEGPELELPLLVTFEADRVIDYRFIPVGSSLPSLELPVKAEYAPNAVLVAAAIRDGRLETSTDPITVIRSLGIELVGPATAKKPGETAEIAIRTVDQAGRPVAAELGLVVIDRAILALGGLPIPDIRKVFYDVKRGHAVTTTSSVAYRYVGALTAIDQDLLDEQKQKAVDEKEKELLEFSRRESDVLKDLADAKPGQSVDAIGIGAGAGGGLRKGQPLGGSRVQRRTAASGGGVAPGANEPAKAAPRPGEMDRAKSKSNDQRLRDKAEAISSGVDAGFDVNDIEERNGAVDEERRATENKAFRSRFKGGEAVEAAANPVLDLEAWSTTAAPTAPVRDHFADVAYYSELVTTDADGRAVVSFTLPDNLTTWQVRAEGATATTLVGAGKTQLTVSKAVEARVAAPRFLTHKDEAEIAAIFENHGSEKIAISGAARSSRESAGTVSGGDEKTATVDAYGSLVLPLLVRPTSPGVLTIAAVAKAGASESDAIDYDLRVLPFGKRLRVGAAGEVLGETVFDLVLAREVLPNTGSLRIAFSRGLGHDLAEATAALLKPARGSIDGLVWRFKPLARIALLLESLGLQSPVKRADLERFITSSLAALLEAQNDDGTFGWWPRTGGDAYMTALALDAMSESTNFAPATFGSARQRALQAAGAALGERATALDAQAYLLFGMRGDAPVEHVNRLTRAARDLSPQGLSWLILSLTALGRDTQAEEAAKRLEGMIRRHEGGTASFSGHATDGFLKSEVESTAWALKALLGRRRSGPDVDALAKRLRDAKRGPGYGTPKETAAVVEALALYAEGKARAEVGGTIDLSVNGRSQKTVEVGGLGEVGSLVIDVPFADVKVGANRIVVKTSRREALRYTAELAGVVGEDEIAAESGAFSIARRITDYVPVERRREKTKPGYTILREEARPPAEPPQAVADLVSGRRYLVNLVIESAEDASYVVVEDPLPAGVEPIEEAVTGDFFRMERRDDRMVFYFDRLRKGKATVEYPVTASYPGNYRTPAPEAYGLYDSRARGSGASLALRVLPEGRSAAATALAKPTPDEIFAKGLEAFGTRQYPEALERLAPLLELDLVEGVRRRLAIAVLLSRLRTADLAKAVRDHQSATQTTGGGVTSDWALDDLKTLGDAYAAVADFEMARSFYGNVLAANFSTEAQYWRRLAELDRNVEASEGLTRLAARWPDSGDAVQTWIECAESWFAIPDPAIKPEVEVRAEMRGQWKRGLAEMRRVLSHFEPDLDSDLGYRYLDRLRRLGLAERCETEATLYLDRHPTSIQAQDAQHLVMQAVFARGDWSGAEAAAKRLVNEKWPTPVSGRVEPRPSRHVDDARYILGRIAHVRGDIALAVDYYGMVKDRFTDAAQSWLFFNEKKLVLPQVTEAAPGALVTVTAQVKNVKSMQAALYGVDLPLVFAVRKSLVRINQVELTGIAPDRRIDTITGAAPYVDAKAAIELGKVEEGAWLMVVGDGETLRTSLVIVSSLKVVLQRQGATMRCYVTDAAKGVPVAGAEVRLGNGARIVGSGKTDERGILVLEGIEPGVTALAASGRAYALATE